MILKINVCIRASELTYVEEVDKMPLTSSIAQYQWENYACAIGSKYQYVDTETYHPFGSMGDLVDKAKEILKKRKMKKYLDKLN